MAFLAIGLNHKTAPVDIREKLSFSPDTIHDALKNLTSQKAVNEAAILSTCNRTEIYCEVDDNDHSIVEWLKDHHALESVNLKEYLYMHSDRDAVNHMLRVASGLDSMVLGEPQILGQMKTAFAVAKEAGCVGQLLHKLFQHTFSCAKQVRTDTAIGASPVSVAFASVSLAKQIFSNFDTHTALLIGAGETIELVSLHLKEVGIKQVIIANRTIEKAHALAAEVGGFAIGLDEIPEHLAEADIVISSTASPLPILGKGAAEAAIKKRKHRPMLMIDIAVPRDIEEQVSDLEDVFLYTVDDLQDIINEGLKSRQEAALKAEEIIETQVTHFLSWLKSLKAVNTMRQFREKNEQIRDNAVTNAKKQLKNGRDAEVVIQELAYQLTNKIIHTPCVQMKKAGMDERHEIIKSANYLFDLEP